MIPRRTHRVGPEDSVYSISQRYAVSQYQLAQLNGLAPPFELKVGQRLLLPGTLDFSVLGTGIPAGVSGAGAKQPKPTPIAAALAVPRKNSSHRPPVPVAFAGRLKARQSQNSALGTGRSQRRYQYRGGKRHYRQCRCQWRVAFVGDNIKSFGKLILVKHNGGVSPPMRISTLLSSKKGISLPLVKPSAWSG